MRDFRLPTNDMALRNIVVASHEQELEQTLVDIETNDVLDSESEEYQALAVRARDAKHIAFELFCSGLLAKKEWDAVVKACEPFILKQEVSRPAR